MKTRPRREGLGFAIANQPISDISIELKDADSGNGAAGICRLRRTSSIKFSGVNADGLIQRMTEDGKSRIFSSCPVSVRSPRSIEDSRHSMRQYRRHRRTE